jgi:hypothetical protein
VVKLLAELDQRVVLLQRTSAAQARGRLPPAGAMGRAGSEVARTVALGSVRTTAAALRCVTSPAMMHTWTGGLSWRPDRWER